MVPPLVARHEQTLVAVGLHALARYFARSGERAEDVVLRDLAAISTVYPAVVKGMARSLATGFCLRRISERASYAPTSKKGVALLYRVFRQPLICELSLRP